jgi:2-polyprenyl-6-methoxyphenol hydroxylase-like FAD-dependent oxidoreductase
MSLISDVLDVLIVGAGPTGLTLAAQLHTFGLRTRLIDRLLDRTRESRALVVQARSLEILESLGLADTLVARGRTTARLQIHVDGHVAAEVRLGDIEAVDTQFPFLLFVSQAETEKVLDEYLTSVGITVEWGVELLNFQTDESGVTSAVRHGNGREEHVRVRYLVGCDGAHSTVRRGVGIPFRGDAYPQHFVLGDVEIDGPLERDSIHSFATGQGFAIFFPLGRPRSWRMIGMETNVPSVADAEEGTSDLSLEELQLVADRSTCGQLRLYDPAWLTRFRLHHRLTAHYRAGRVFLAGDAAHIHSPVGGQGMNTGIQDAWNLGWKLALVARGVAGEALLESYEAERWPIGRFLLRTTDRIFSVFATLMSTGPLSVRLLQVVASRLMPWVVSRRRGRAFAFRAISELAIHYRKSPAVTEGQPRLRRGPKAGDRLPDASVTRDGQDTSLHQEMAGPHLNLLLCGVPERWDAAQVAALRESYGDLLKVHYLSGKAHPGDLRDGDGTAFSRLGVREAGQYLVRPDGYVGFRSSGTDLNGLFRYLARWFPGPAATERKNTAD